MNESKELLTFYNSNYIVENGVLTWDDGKIDIAPEEVYKNSFEFWGVKLKSDL